MEMDDLVMELVCGRSPRKTTAADVREAIGVQYAMAYASLVRLQRNGRLRSEIVGGTRTFGTVDHAGVELRAHAAPSDMATVDARIYVSGVPTMSTTDPDKVRAIMALIGASS